LAKASFALLFFPPHKWDGNEFYTLLLLFIAVWLQPTAKLKQINGFSLKFMRQIASFKLYTLRFYLQLKPIALN